MIQFVERDIDVIETSRLPTNKRTLTIESDPIEVTASSNLVHINNTADPGGDGSFDDPFNSITACNEANDGTHCGNSTDDSIIYIHAGDGTSNGLDETITLQDNQKLIGQGYNFMGIGGDKYPQLKFNPSIDLCFDGNGCIGTTSITLGNNNEIAGVAISDSFQGIQGINITDFNIHNNKISNTIFGIIVSTNSPIRAFSRNEDDGDPVPFQTERSDRSRSNILNLSVINTEVITNGVISNNIISGLKNDTEGANLPLTSGISIFNSASSFGEETTATQDIKIYGNNVSGNGNGLFVSNSANSRGNAIQTIDMSSGDNLFNNNKNGANILNNPTPGVSTSFFRLNPPLIRNGDARKSLQTINMSSANNQFNDNSDYGFRIANSFLTPIFDDDVTAKENVNVVNEQIIKMQFGNNQFNNNSIFGVSLTNNSEFGEESNQTINGQNGNNQFNNNRLGGFEIKNRTQYGGNSNQEVNFSFGWNTFNNNHEGLFISNGRTSYISTLSTLPDLPNIISGNTNQDINLSGSNQATGNSSTGAHIRNFNDDPFPELTMTPPMLEAVQTIDLSGMDLSNSGFLEIIDLNIGDGIQTLTPP